MNRSRSHAGFTFLEVILAVTLLGILMASVFSIWSAGLNGWKKTSGVSDSFQRERVVMTALADLTKSIVYANSKDDLYDVVSAHHSRMGDTVSFVTASTALLAPSEQSAAGMRRVTLGMQYDVRGRPFLGISSEPALVQTDENQKEPASPPRIISRDVCGFAVRYRHPRDNSMKESWEEPNLVPAAIEYTVAFGANDGRTPPIIVTRSVDLPVAPYALQLLGQALSQANTTNTVQRRDIDLMPDGGAGDNQ